MSDVNRLLMATLGSLIVLVAGILWQFKKGAATWIKFISSLGLRKKEIDDKDFLCYRISGIVYIIIGALMTCLSVLSLLRPSIIYKLWSLFY